MRFRKLQIPHLLNMEKVMSDIPVEWIKEMNTHAASGRCDFMFHLWKRWKYSGCGGSRKRIWRAADSDWVL